MTLATATATTNRALPNFRGNVLRPCTAVTKRYPLNYEESAAVIQGYGFHIKKNRET